MKKEVNLWKMVKDKNILKLLDTNFELNYINKDGYFIETILFVHEYTHTNFQDLALHYKDQQILRNESIARTYFHQLIDGLYALHTNGIYHQGIRLENLLLDTNFVLKIADFGLDRMINKFEDTMLGKEFYETTLRYIAPEILILESHGKEKEKEKENEKQKEIKCQTFQEWDIFACGVVLFIFLSGYPPFVEASAKCRWYAPLITNNTAKFWKQHRGCGIPLNAKDLITRMIWFDKMRRNTISRIRKHKWYCKPIVNQQELSNQMREACHECNNTHQRKEERRGIRNLFIH